MDIKPKAIYEDGDFLVVYKPSGLIVHPKNKDDDQPTLVDWVVLNYPQIKNIGEPFSASGTSVPRAGIVHRLDKETSGLIIVAKTEESFYYFKNLFQERKIKKYYIALVYGKLKEAQGTIKAPLGRMGIKRTTKVTGKKLIDQKEAETSYRAIKYFKDYTLLELSPKTGRTHQLRVHMNHLGHPIAGDRIYGFKKLSPVLGLNRLFLHAYKLEFSSPSGNAITIEMDLPEELQNILNDVK